MLAADYLVMGSISVVKVESHIEKIPYVSRYNRTHEGIIIVDMRIVETEKGRIVAAEKGETKLKDEEMKDTQYIDPVPPEFYDRLLRKLVDSLTQSIIDAVYPVKIVKIDGDTVYLNRGEGGGLRPQQQLTVFMLGKEIVDPDTHESLGFAEKEIGLLKVTEVLQKMTKAKILEQSNGISVGSICRKSDKKKRETTQETDSRKKPELAF